MDGSRVIQNLDSLWFSTNIFTCTYHQPVASLTDDPFEPSRCESQNVENMTPPRCLKCGQSSPPAFEEVKAVSEMVGKSAGREREKEKRDGRMRRKWSKFGLNLGGLDLGFEVPFDDVVAMKQHLKSWAYAVACTVK